MAAQQQVSRLAVAIARSRLNRRQTRSRPALLSLLRLPIPVAK